jgi:hypothetical protein
MPNWSFNILKINGSIKRLDEFYKFNKSEERELCFYKSIPMPKDIFTGSLHNYDCNNGKNWYNWNIDNFGTKWNSRESSFKKEIKYDKGGLETLLILNRKLDANIETIRPIIESLFKRHINVYYFDTAWAPPIKWLLTTAEKWKDLEFFMESELEGDDWGRRVRIINGELVEDEWFSPAEEHYERNKEGMNKIVNSLRVKLDLDNYQKKNLDDKEDIIEQIRDELDVQYYWFPDSIVESIINELIYKK